jgi:hypothetical protein
MNIELRKISYNASLSEETSAYTAQVWVDDVHVCDVANHGQGGCDMQLPAKGKTRADIDALNTAIKNERGTETTKYGERSITIDIDLEHVCGELLADHLIRRDLQRLLKRTVAFVRDGKLYTCKRPPKNQGERFNLIRHFHKENADNKVLNSMTFDEALTVFRSVQQ